MNEQSISELQGSTDHHKYLVENIKQAQNMRTSSLEDLNYR